MAAESVTGIGPGSAGAKLLFARDIRYLGGLADNLQDVIPLLSEAKANHVLVKSSSDLPTPVSGEHILEENTAYEINGTVVSTSAIRISPGCTIYGSLAGDTFVYLGTGAALRATNLDSTFVGRFFNIVAPMGSGIDISGTIEHQLMLFFMGFVNCHRIGTISNFDVASIKSCLFTTNDASSVEGLEYDGTFNKILIDGSPFQHISGLTSAIKIKSTCSVRVIDIVGNYFKYDSEEAAVWVEDGASLTVAGMFRGNAFDGTVPATNGFDSSTPMWDFSSNIGVKDSQVMGLFHITTPAITDVIETGVAVKAAGSTEVDILERFSHSNNRLTYTGVKSDLVEVDVTYTIDADGNNKELSVYVAKNGVIRTPSRSRVRVATGSDNRSGACIDLLEIEPGDYLEIWIANDTDDVDITVLDMTMRVRD